MEYTSKNNKIAKENSNKENVIKKYKKRSQMSEVWRRLKKNKMAMVGLFIIVVLIIMALSADLVVDYDTDVIGQNVKIRLQSPSLEHWCGTDEFGRDILSRIIYGSRISLSVGLVSVTISLVIGVTLGAIAGFYGKGIDNIIMRFMDIFLAIPETLLAITIVAALGPSMINLMLAVGFANMPSYARVVRASVLTVKDQEFVEAAKAIGAKNSRIIIRHIMPNCFAPLIVQVTLRMATAILSTAALSFIGLGVKAPSPEWGAMLSSGRSFLRDSSHITLFPGLTIMITILSLNLLGDGLRDALDPRLKQ